MGEKKEKSRKILDLMEQFQQDFGEAYNIEKSISCIYGVPESSLSEKGFMYNFLISGLSVPNNRTTFAIIKPNSVYNKDSVKIIKDIEEAGFKIFAANLRSFSKEVAEKFYEEHKGKVFFDRLIEFMTSGSVITLVLEKENAIEDFRNLMGSVGSEYKNTIRGNYAEGHTKNSIHGSDSYESVCREIKFF